MAKMYISRQVVIEMPKNEVFPLVHDFHFWIKWSPWHILDDENNFTVSEDGSHYSWESKLLGSGEMTRKSEIAGKEVVSDLIFLKPWKSKSKIIFTVRELTENSCEVTWEMLGHMPFFMFFLVKMMERMVGMDFSRGLNLLKDFAETGQNRCELSMLGEKTFQARQYLGIQVGCGLDDLGKEHKAAFEKLMGFVRSEGLDLHDYPATLYHKFDMRKYQTSFTVVAPVREIPKTLPSGFVSTSFPGGKFFGVEMKGPYHHLGNAWSAIMTRERGKSFKSDRSRAAIEIYLNSPIETPADELKTQIFSPIR